MVNGPQLSELLADLSRAERYLLRRHRIRLRVDKLSADGLNAICSAAQVGRRFMRAAHAPHEGVAVCYHAISPLYRIGLSPLIGWMPGPHTEVFDRVDPADPFLLSTAFRTAGIAPSVVEHDPSEPVIKNMDHHR